MRKYLFLTLAVFVLVVAAFYWRNVQENSFVNKVVYIDNIRVFNEFQMKKDYDLLIEKDLIIESKKLDSIGQFVSKLDRTPNVIPAYLASQKQIYFSYKQDFEEKYQKLSKNYTQQVYERLNAYVAEFGEQKEFRIILGTNGDGGIMYVAKNADVTELVISYINKKYLDN